MKCEICHASIEEMFLEKIRGTTVKDGKGKQHTICYSCQQRFPAKKQILEQINAPVA